MNRPDEVQGEILATSTVKVSCKGTALPSPEIVKSTLREELVPICRCESGLRQFDDDGNVIRGAINSHDIGICQINEFYWGDKAKELGYDIYTENGNIDMANWIFETKGAQPWNWSKSCWSKKL